MDPGRLRQTGVTMFRLEGGKIRHVKDCILDQEVIATAYPHNGADVAESSARTTQYSTPSPLGSS